MLDMQEIEKVEEACFSLVIQALRDYWSRSVVIFSEEEDAPQDIAEDLTREAIDSLGVSGVSDRLYGKVDYKRGIYAFLPEPHLIALMVDAKAEKSNGDRTATIQMSQTSMSVRMVRQGREVNETGRLKKYIDRGEKRFQVFTAVVKYVYTEHGDNRKLNRIIAACIPNGLLQERYNPSPKDGIWLVGRDAPTRGEDFRVRISFNKLRKKAPWRVAVIE